MILSDSFCDPLTRFYRFLNRCLMTLLLYFYRSSNDMPFLLTPPFSFSGFFQLLVLAIQLPKYMLDVLLTEFKSFIICFHREEEIVDHCMFSRFSKCLQTDMSGFVMEYLLNISR